MELVQLRTFLAVLEHRGFRPAARKLFLSQSAVSRQVAELERSIGVPLVIRGPVYTQPTTAGLTLADRAQDLLDDYQRAVTAARRRLPPCDRLVIGLPPGGVGELTAPLLRHLGVVLPNTQITAWTFDLLTWPNSPPDGSDLLVLHDPISPELRFTTLVEQQLCLAVPERFPEASAEGLSLAETLLVPLARASPGVGRALRDFWMLQDARGGLQPELRGDCFDSTTGIADALAHGTAASLSTTMLLRLHGQSHTRTVRISGAPNDRVALVSRGDDRREVIDLVHRETSWLISKIGPLVLPELARSRPWPLP